MPTVSIGPLAGVFVDRWDKRRTMITADLIRFGLMAALSLVPTVGTQLPTTIRLGAIYTVIMLATVCSTFFGPAQIGLLGSVVPPEERTRAASLSQLSVYLGLMLGPPLAAPLLFGLGPAWGLAVNAASFLVSAIAVRAIAARAPGAPKAAAGVRGVLRDFVSGLRFIAKQRVLRALLVSIFMVVSGAGALNALGVFFFQSNLHAPVRLYGFVAASVAVGALAGAALTAILASRIDPPRLFSGSVIALGLAIVVYSRMTALLPALLVALLVGFPEVAVNIAVTPILPAVTPAELVGRVSATLMPTSILAQIGSVALSGYFASTLLRDLHAQVLGVQVGTYDAIFGVASLLIVASGVYATVSMRRRTVAPSAEAALQPP